jgi:hypothetical protein
MSKSETGTPPEVELFAEFLCDAAGAINDTPAALWTYEEVREACTLLISAFRRKTEEAHAAYLLSLRGGP